METKASYLVLCRQGIAYSRNAEVDLVQRNLIQSITASITAKRRLIIMERGVLGTISGELYRPTMQVDQEGSKVSQHRTGIENTWSKLY